MAKRPSILMMLPPLIFLIIAGLFYVGMQRGDANTLPSTLEGKLAPAVVVDTLNTLPSFGDAELRQEGFKLVNFWASWCTPCRAEHPSLIALKERGVKIYGVNYKDEPANAQKFLDDLGNPYAAIGADRSGRMAIDWGVYGVPETYIIDSDGKIVLRFAGPITERSLNGTILPALGLTP